MTNMEDEELEPESALAPEEAALEPASEEVEETIDDVKARLAQAEADKAKADEVANNQRIRAEKAEAAAKGNKPKPLVMAAPKAGALDTGDLYALMEAKVPQEDVKDVAEYAKFKGISIAEALKSTTVKGILADKEEQRNVAAATNVGPARRGSVAPTDQTLVGLAQKGEMPESDEDLRRLTVARRARKK